MMGKKALKGASQSTSAVDVSSVFSTYVYTSNGADRDIVNGIDLATDGGMVWIKARTGTAQNHHLFDTERWTSSASSEVLRSNTTDEQTNLSNGFDSFNTDGFSLGDAYGGTNANAIDYVSWTFKKQPRFFDIVKYTGNHVAGREIVHNLGCDVGMIIVKARTSPQWWIVGHTSIGTDYLVLNETFAKSNATSIFATSPTDSVFTVETDYGVNGNGVEYIAYLFATLAGISKVGSYTGNGTSQTIDCGFSTGAKFIIIKRTDLAGDWVLADSTRGITTGNVPYLKLNTTDAEDTDEDCFDPSTLGFIVNQTVGANLNVNGATYVYYSISN
jgi:hypothetical protein